MFVVWLYLLRIFGKRKLFIVVLSEIVSRNEMISVVIMLVVIGFINFLVFLGNNVMGVNLSIVVRVEFNKGNYKCFMEVLIVLWVLILFNKWCWMVFVIMIVVFIKSLRVMMRLVIDIWWIGILIMFNIVSVVKLVRGIVSVIMIVDI